MAPRFFSIRRNEAGVSFLELAIALPVLLIVVVGLVDVWFSLSRRHIISEAAQKAAFTGFLQVASATTGEPTCAASAGEICCADLLASVTPLVQDEAERFLTDAGFDPAAWQPATVELSTPPINNAPLLGTPGRQVRVLDVTLKPQDDAPTCLFCVFWRPVIEVTRSFPIIRECVAS